MLGALQRNNLLAMTSGLLLWTLYFLFSYVFLSLGCALGLSEIRLGGMNLVHLVILAVTLVILLAIGYLVWRAWQQYRLLGRNPASGRASSPIARQRFMALVAVMIHGLAVVAVLWVAAPVILAIPPCL